MALPFALPLAGVFTTPAVKKIRVKKKSATSKNEIALIQRIDCCPSCSCSPALLRHKYSKLHFSYTNRFFRLKLKSISIIIIHYQNQPLTKKQHKYKLLKIENQ
jgi:hypothetical protein